MMMPPPAAQLTAERWGSYSAAGDGHGAAGSVYSAHGTDYARSVHQLAAGIAASGSRGA